MIQKRYSVLRNLIIKKSREAKEKYLKKMNSEIETLIKTGSRDETYKMVKKFFGQHEPRTGGVENNNGRMLYVQKDIEKNGKNI